jgi:hypothetical protein
MLLRAYGILACSARLLALLLVLTFAAGAHAADLCGSDGPPKEGDRKPLALADGGCFRLSQGRPACLDACVSQCRQAERACSGDRSACRTQFQICTRRCVVSCGAR